MNPSLAPEALVALTTPTNFPGRAFSNTSNLYELSENCGLKLTVLISRNNDSPNCRGMPKSKGKFVTLYPPLSSRTPPVSTTSVFGLMAKGIPLDTI